MLRCQTCSHEAPEGSRFCPSCATPLAPADGPVTKTSVPRQAESVSRADRETSAASGHRNPSSSLDNVRFLPGMMIEDRYRIVGPIGRGGMGEVYRADDLKLGQPVALKFLPEGLERDASRLSRFFNEVRTARQVTHPAVCRVYDTGEYQGQHYISMEYVDGEDLASLLRRIGRLPQEKAVQIARQLCAGVAAAHEQGILHRDLKPANVMLDGRGQVKVTDFGLAGLAEGFEGAEIRVGTPAYMAPEQFSGQQVTVRSDLYSLGLVLYELFTGKPAFEAGSRAQLQSMHQTTPATPSSVVDGLDPTVERVILRCLERDPHQRPASALSVSAALPGGDPLAEALAAGETPSPEMVAQAGGEGGVRPLIAVSAMVFILIGFAVSIVISQGSSLLPRMNLEKPPEALKIDAQEILAATGYDQPTVDSAFGFEPVIDYFEWVERNDQSPTRWDGIEQVRPAPIRFWYRQSPRKLVPTSFFSELPHVTESDPPSIISGMTTVVLDPEGRLVSLEVVPPERSEKTDPATEPDWSSLFARAGLDPASFEEVRPEWHPLFDCDVRAAWTGHYADLPEQPVRVEAGAFEGKPVYFRVVPPWSKPRRMEATAQTVGENIGNAILLTILFVLLTGGMLLARRNLRLGRGDRRGAFRFATFIFVVQVLAWVAEGDHVLGFSEVGLLFQQVGQALFMSGSIWLFYIALEPHVRRLWPDLIISWTRLLSGRFRDPLVGRAILAGCTCFVFNRLWSEMGSWLTNRIGDPAPRPGWIGLPMLEGFGNVAGQLFKSMSGAGTFPVMILFFLLLLRVLLRRQWAAMLVLVGLITTAGILGNPEINPLVLGILIAPLWFLVLFVMIRFGLLAVMVWIGCNFVESFPFTSDFSLWYSGRTVVGLLFFVALVGYGFWISLAGRPLFTGDFLPDQLEPSQR